MKKSFVTALAVALLGAMTLGAVTSSASAPHKPAKNIVQTAVAAGSFKTLVSLVKQAGLAGSLRNMNPKDAPVNGAYYSLVKSITATGPYTVAVSFKNIVAPFYAATKTL